MDCPHCGKAITEHTTVVTNQRHVRGDMIPPEDYHPNPARKYKTTDKSRRTSLAWYWKNRAHVLARERRYREERKAAKEARTAVLSTGAV